MNLTAILSLIESIVGLLSRRSKVKKLVLPLIEQAAANSSVLTTNEARRGSVISALMGRGLSESSARLLTEAGVKLWKKLAARAARKAARAARKG